MADFDQDEFLEDPDFLYSTYDDSYHDFADVYDIFMDNIPYDMWTDYIHSLLLEYGIKDGLVLDMGCGTGNVTERLASKGYDMIGIDNSEEMLMVAREKAMESETGASILYLLQDMRDFELYGTVEAIVCVCDSINYITEYDDLVKVFSLANNYLESEGIMIFDFKTPYLYKEVMGNNTIAENREDASFIWENHYDEEAHVNVYDLTIFHKEILDLGDEELEAFARYRETHCQRAWTIEEFKNAATVGGMKVLAVYDAFTKEEPRSKSERLYMIVQEQRKEGKYYE